MKEPEIKLRMRVVCQGGDAFGPGKAQLLESLQETGSLNQSAGALKMSYVKALALVRAMNAHFEEPLVKHSRGGKRGGGTEVTEIGRTVLSAYQAMQAAGEKAARPAWRRLRRFLKG